MTSRKNLSRRDFMVRSAAAGVAVGLARGTLAQGLGDRPVRCGFIGVGGRGTGLLKVAVTIPGVEVPAICDINKDHLARAIGIVEKAHSKKPQGYSAGPTDYRNLLARDDLDAVVIAVPCDLHAQMYLDAIAAGKHLYGEKPMCLTVEDCRRIVTAEARSNLVVQIGFQRRCNPRYREAIKLVHAGEIGDPIEARAAWCNAWGPLRGWFSIRARSGDWMLEQACHTWDVLNWVARSTPVRAFGTGRRDIYTDVDPGRDVTDYYTATLEYPNGMTVSFLHSWFCPNDGAFTGVYERVAGIKGGVDLGAGKFIYRDRDKPSRTVGPKQLDDTRLSVESFFDCVRKGTKPLSGVRNGRDAVLVGLLVRKAVDARRVVTWDEIVRS